MSANNKRLQGEVSDGNEEGSRDVERMIIGFLRSLLEEQKQTRPSPMELFAEKPAETPAELSVEALANKGAQ